jgi:hypothetical protein
MVYHSKAKRVNRGIKKAKAPDFSRALKLGSIRV